MRLSVLQSSLIAVALVFVGGPLCAQDTLRIGGTGAAMATMKRLGDAFSAATGTRIDVLPTLGTRGGIHAVADGIIDIGVAGRRLYPEEAGMGLKEILVARTPFGFVTSHRNPNGFKIGEIADIYKADAPRWADGTPILVILRPKADADSALLARLFPGMAAALDRARQRTELPVAGNDQSNADLAERLPGSFTAAALSQVQSEQRRLRFVAIDGVLPTLENYKNGLYPYGRPIFFIIASKPSPTVDRFLAFVRSGEGQRLLRATGNLPDPH